MNLKEFSFDQLTLLNKSILHKLKYSKILAILSTLFILVASLLPPSHAIRVNNFPFADKGEHLSAYAVLGFFLFSVFADSLISKRILNNDNSKISWIKSSFFKTLLFGIPLGVIIEVLQMFVGRSFDVFDMLADAIGLSVGCFFAILIMKLIINNSIKKIKDI